MIPEKARLSLKAATQTAGLVRQGKLPASIMGVVNDVVMDDKPSRQWLEA
jgi:hypothetical protein